MTSPTTNPSIKPLTPRAEVQRQFTWNSESVFASPADFEAEVTQIASDIPQVTPYQGKLSDPATLLAALTLRDELGRRTGVVNVYAGMASNVDTNDVAANAMDSRAGSLWGTLAAATAFIEPELIALGKDRVLELLDSSPELAVYHHYADDLFRQQEHVRSAEVEEVLGLASEPLGNPYNVYSFLTNAELQFTPGKDSEGNPVQTSQSGVLGAMFNSDREVRRTVWESFMDAHYDVRNTIAANLTGAIKRDVFYARARRYSSALEASLHPNNIPVEVFHNLIETFKKNIPTWHRYWRIRKKALGVDTLQPYDVWAPLTAEKAEVTYPQAVDYISTALQPLGDEYVSTLRRGCLEDRWVDLYPNVGKRQGAFSSGTKGTHPFIMMSYLDKMESMSTLAHELGHSMHSYYTWKTQPTVYTDYSLFVAEVASNFNQAMMRDHLLKSNPDRNFQISVLEEAISNNLHRYFFIMPTLARWELEMHTRIEQGQGVTADDMIDLMADLFAEGYGGEVNVDRNRTGMTWATFGHLYANFYVFQYATGISAAHALADKVLNGGSSASNDYLNFLKAGASRYPLDVLNSAGVDLTTPAAVEKTFATLAQYVDRLESLLDQ